MGVAFWLRHDVLRVLDAWEEAAPRSRVHVVTVPPAASPAEELLGRFAAVLDLPPDLLSADSVSSNASWGAAQIELLRRLNRHLGSELKRRPYLDVVNKGLGPGLTSGPRRELQLPAESLSWIRELAAEVVDELGSRGYQVHGDLSDLVPTAPAQQDALRLDEATEAELLDLAERGLSSLALAHGDLLKRHWRVVANRGVEGSPRGRLASSARAAAFRSKERALEASDHSRALAWIARQYVRRTSGRRAVAARSDEKETT